MITGSLTDRARELSEAGRAFVTATVVRAQRPTSAKPGDVALVHADGTIEGFVGGVCAEQSVRAYSLQAIDRGEPLLLRIRAEAGEDAAEEGAVTVHNPCLSGGSIEIFLEPLLPPPRMTVAGDSLIAQALLRLGAELGLDTGGHGAAGPRAGDLALVVAAHGRDELAALRTALEAELPYVGLVASRTRGVAVLEELRAAGLPEGLLERIDTPAGLDIGARTPAEIALSILARVVEVRRRSGAAVAPARATAAATTAVDPICGMTVVVGPGTPSLEHAGETHYFCCEGCRARFDAQRA